MVAGFLFVRNGDEENGINHLFWLKFWVVLLVSI